MERATLLLQHPEPSVNVEIFYFDIFSERKFEYSNQHQRIIFLFITSR